MTTKSYGHDYSLAAKCCLVPSELDRNLEPVFQTNQKLKMALTAKTNVQASERGIRKSIFNRPRTAFIQEGHPHADFALTMQPFHQSAAISLGKTRSRSGNEMNRVIYK